MQTQSDTAVFLGPTLPVGRARDLLPTAWFLPPVRYGDIYRLLASGIKRILVVDGLFHGTPSVWPRELLAAIDEGVEVVGAASMGALRAAELAEYGMRGLGTIYEWYADGNLDGDDEVALLHGDESSGYQPLSVPLVNTRHALQQAVSLDLLTAAAAAALLQGLKSQPYGDRSWRSLTGAATFNSLESTKQAALRRLFASPEADLKAQDAAKALAWCASHQVSPPPVPAPDWRHNDAGLWADGRLIDAGFLGPWGVATGRDVLVRLAAHPGLERTLRREAHLAGFVLDWLRRTAIELPAEAPAEPAEIWPAAPAARRRALAENGLTEALLARLTESWQMVSRVTTAGPGSFGLSGEGPEAFLAAWAGVAGVAASPGELLERGPSSFGLERTAAGPLLGCVMRRGLAGSLLRREAAL